MDITQFIQTQHALRESQDRFRVALASAPLYVFNCDRELRYTWVSQAFSGFEVEDILRKRDDEIFPAEAVTELIAAKQWAIETGQSGIREVRLLRPEGIRYYILALEPEKDQNGDVIGLTCSAIDITEQRQLEIKQKEKAMQAEVQRRLLEYREQGRQQMAREIHDGPIQNLSGTIFGLQAICESTTDSKVLAEIDEALTNIKVSIQELREITNELRPPGLIGFGLAKSVRMHIEEFREKNQDIQIYLQTFEDGNLLPEMMRLALFRIYQEALNNIAKHACASQVWVKIYKKANKINLQIRDNGLGFPTQPDLVDLTQLGHYGLAGMKERAEGLGGTFQVTSRPGKGSMVLVSVPFEIVKVT